jgi:hypothetical protein
VRTLDKVIPSTKARLSQNGGDPENFKENRCHASPATKTPRLVFLLFIFRLDPAERNRPQRSRSRVKILFPFPFYSFQKIENREDLWKAQNF